MKKKFIFVVLFLTAITLMARENPFKVVTTSSTTGKATHKKDTRESFTSKKIKLPSSSRILKKLELSFQNLDGSIETKSVLIDKKIDWHDELILKKVNDTEDSITAPIELPKIKKVVKKTKINFKNIVLFTISNKELHVKTTDKKIRDFLVTNPYKIVLDFKNEISFYTKVYKLDIKNYKSITVGKHDGYYRVAIELDGRYLYDIKKVKDGYLINLK